MANQNEVFINTRQVCLDLAISEEHIGKLMAEFGRGVFKPHFTCTLSQASDDRVQVTVRAENENELYDFLQNFCLKRNLSFRKPETQPAA